MGQHPTFPHTPSNGTVLDKKLKSGKWDAKVFIRSILWLAPQFIWIRSHHPVTTLPHSKYSRKYTSQQFRNNEPIIRGQNEAEVMSKDTRTKETASQPKPILTLDNQSKIDTVVSTHSSHNPRVSNLSHWQKFEWYQRRPQTVQVNQLNQIALSTTLFLGFFSTVYFCTSRVNFCSLKVYLCNLKVYLYFESILLYLESIPLYFESIPLYFESIFLYFESTFVYFESILLYFQSILLYFESIL